MMRRIVAASSFLVVLVVVGQASYGVGADGRAQLAASCGDFNDDRHLNVSDAVYLLNWLFLAGFWKRR